MNISSAWHKSIHQKWSDVKQTDWSVQYKQDHENQQYFCMRFNIRTMRTSCFDQQHNYNYITACHQSSRTGRFYLEILIFVSSSVIAMDHQFAIILSFSLTPIWWNIDRVEKVLGGILPKNESFFELLLRNQCQIHLFRKQQIPSVRYDTGLYSGKTYFEPPLFLVSLNSSWRVSEKSTCGRQTEKQIVGHF